jgi:hypothetical protein
VVAAITGLMLGQLTSPRPDFEDKVFRPALERLFTSLVAERAAAGQRPETRPPAQAAESPVEGWPGHG